MIFSVFYQLSRLISAGLFLINTMLSKKHLVSVNFLSCNNKSASFEGHTFKHLFKSSQLNLHMCKTVELWHRFYNDSS